jgi:hypothetical protein
MEMLAFTYCHGAILVATFTSTPVIASALIGCGRFPGKVIRVNATLSVSTDMGALEVLPTFPVGIWPYSMIIAN